MFQVAFLPVDRDRTPEGRTSSFTAEPENHERQYVKQVFIKAAVSGSKLGGWLLVGFSRTSIL